jgi:two-component system, LuxR family, response regulator FixJ
MSQTDDPNAGTNPAQQRLPTEPPVVYVVDDDAVSSQWAETLLRKSGYAARAFVSAEAFLAACGPDSRGCIVLDVNMPGLRGPELQIELKNRGIQLPVVFLTGHADVATAVAVMRRGAVDLIEKPANADELLTRVAEALSMDARSATDRAARAEVNERVGQLSPREREVFELVAAGLANKQIGFKLGISERTVEVHRARVMAKLGVHSAAELATLHTKLV